MLGDYFPEALAIRTPSYEQYDLEHQKTVATSGFHPFAAYAAPGLFEPSCRQCEANRNAPDGKYMERCTNELKREINDRQNVQDDFQRKDIDRGIYPTTKWTNHNHTLQVFLETWLECQKQRAIGYADKTPITPIIPITERMDGLIQAWTDATTRDERIRIEQYIVGLVYNERNKMDTHYHGEPRDFEESEIPPWRSTVYGNIPGGGKSKKRKSRKRKSKKRKSKKRKSKKRKSKKRKSVKRKSRKRKSQGKCRKILGRKMGINMKEYESGRYISRAQAAAVSYSQVNKEHPYCRRVLKRK